jgi:predicted RND superfamily exporter protein
MVLCWISAFTLLPAFLCLMERMKPLVRGKTKPPAAPLAGAVANLVHSRPGLIWAISVGLTVLSLATFTRYTPAIIETNLAKLRNKESLTHGAAFLSKNLDDIFQRYLSPMVILPQERADTLKIAEKLREKKEAQGPGSMIASVQTMDDFIPTQQEEKIKLLREIKEMLPPKLLHRMSADDQRLVAQYLTPAVFKPIGIRDLPDLVIKKFTERDGSVGKLVLVEPPLSEDTGKGERLIQFIHDLRDTADSVKAGTPLAGGLPITSDMIEAVTSDGPRATFFAFVAVVVLVIVLFRNLATISLVLFSLMIGVLWLGGLILGLDLKINFLNFIALPITFGIGVDYGVNIFQRYREEGSGSILKVIRHTGGAVGLCSFTTITGYMSLLIAGNQGFVSFGRLAVAGEITCVIAAVISLPAYLTWRDRKKPSATFGSAGASSGAIAAVTTPGSRPKPSPEL